MKSPQLDKLKGSLRNVGRFMEVHSRMIWFVLMFSVIIGTFISLNLALYRPSDEEYRATKMQELQSSRFDTETIKKIQNLNAREQTNVDALPSGQRINPFGE